MEKTAVFDRTRPIIIGWKHPDGDKKIEVRYPSDDEMIARQRARKIYIKQQGRGASDTDVPDYSDNDLVLLRKLLVAESELNKGVEVDGYEAQAVLERICRAEVRSDGVVDSSGGYEITLHVPGCETVHSLKVPTAKQLSRYRRAFSSVRDLPRGRQEMTIHMEAAGDIYDELLKMATGYPQETPARPLPDLLLDVPINHKIVVVQTVIAELEGATALNDGNFS